MLWQVDGIVRGRVKRWTVTAPDAGAASVILARQGIQVTNVAPFQEYQPVAPVRPLAEPADAWPVIVDDIQEPTEEPEDPHRAALIASLRAGHLPVVQNPPIGLYAGEQAHFVFHASASQRQFLGTRSEGESAGITFFDNGMAFSVGASEGRTVPVYGQAWLGSGLLILTNLRLIFASAGHSFALAWPQVLGVTPWAFDVVIAHPGGRAIHLGCHDGGLISECIRACMTRK